MMTSEWFIFKYVLKAYIGRYERYYERFKSIFEIPYSPSPVHHIPGNHDTG